jgi:hypothetical protein
MTDLLLARPMNFYDRRLGIPGEDWLPCCRGLAPDAKVCSPPRPCCPSRDGLLAALRSDS